MSNDLKEQMLALLKEDDEIVEAVARRLEQSVLFRELREFREEVNRRFEAVDKRFEAMQQQMDKRFEAMQQTMRQELGAMNVKIAAIHEDFADTRKWVNVVVGGLGTRAGRNLEDAVAGTLRVALNMKDLRPETIKLRQKVVDEAGMIGPAGRSYEYDIFASNGETCVFEVKTTPDCEDVDRFGDKCDLVSKKQGGAPVRRVIVTLAKTPELIDYCKSKGIELA